MGNSSSSLKIDLCCGAQVQPYADALSHMRVEEFRNFPYLYNGTHETEREAIHRYIDSQESRVILAVDENTKDVRGFLSGFPVIADHTVFPTCKPFMDEAGVLPEKIFYLGEIILDEACRGDGTGRQMMELFFREVEKMDQFSHIAFITAVRPKDHPLRPSTYRPLHYAFLRYGFKQLGTFEMPYQTFTTTYEKSEMISNTLAFWLAKKEDILSKFFSCKKISSQTKKIPANDDQGHSFIGSKHNVV